MQGQPSSLVSYGAPGSSWGGPVGSSWGGPVAREPRKPVFDFSAGQVRRRLNVVSVCSSFLAPWMLFMVVFGILSFHLHYTRPALCWFAVILAFLVVVIFGVFALRASRKNKAESNQDPTWFVFLFATCLLAWIFGVSLGLWNWSSMVPHYQMTALNTYNNVDVAAISSTGVLDAGRLTFKAGSYIDTSKAIGFKNVDTYCVAPVTSSKTPLLTYDFWATGVNCCSGQPGDFHCGEVDGRLQLNGGERLLNDAEIPYLTLATQQAEAFHHLKVGHAIFFKSVADPLGAESRDMDRGVKFFCLCSLLFFGMQGVAVVLMLVLKK